VVVVVVGGDGVCVNKCVSVWFVYPTRRQLLFSPLLNVWTRSMTYHML
jgi:hypothetical protein